MSVCLASMERATASTRDDAPFVEQRRTSDHRAKTQRAPSTTNATRARVTRRAERASQHNKTTDQSNHSTRLFVRRRRARREQPAQPSETTTNKKQRKERKPHTQTSKQHSSAHRLTEKTARHCPSTQSPQLCEQRARREATNTTQCLSGLFLLWRLLTDRRRVRLQTTTEERAPSRSSNVASSTNSRTKRQCCDGATERDECRAGVRAKNQGQRAARRACALVRRQRELLFAKRFSKKKKEQKHAVLPPCNACSLAPNNRLLGERVGQRAWTPSLPSRFAAHKPSQRANEEHQKNIKRTSKEHQKNIVQLTHRRRVALLSAFGQPARRRWCAAHRPHRTRRSQVATTHRCAGVRRRAPRGLAATSRRRRAADGVARAQRRDWCGRHTPQPPTGLLAERRAPWPSPLWRPAARRRRQAEQAAHRPRAARTHRARLPPLDRVVRRPWRATRRRRIGIDRNRPESTASNASMKDHRCWAPRCGHSSNRQRATRVPSTAANAFSGHDKRRARARVAKRVLITSRSKVEGKRNQQTNRRDTHPTDSSISLSAHATTG